MKLKPIAMFLALGVAATVTACGGNDATTEPADDTAPATEEVAPAEDGAPTEEMAPADGAATDEEMAPEGSESTEGGEGGEG